ncbi:type II secretion system secretin GspD [Aquincola tertiaricarbonis]|uniref:type II secretion system secretin GspD n=1 Tax=Aquincola tertiaricarbonis TaxID=391953 RepID=UPI0009FB647D|nr:type II secretion system secretin GspD [Aquincola tertiaricarbonis]
MNYRVHALVGALACAGMVLPPPLLAQQPTRPASAAAARASTPVTLNFVNADIEAVTRAIGAILDRQFLVDPRVKGTITVYSDQPVPVTVAYQNYLAALRGLGFAVVESGGLLKVVPEADAKLQTGTVTIGQGQPRGDQVITQIFKLSHENPNNLVAILRPLISANNTINANPSNSTLVITDYADNLQRLGRIISALDQPANTDIEVVPLQHAVASDMAALVQRLADGGGGAAVPGVPVAPGGAGAGSGSVLADPRSNSLIVRAANPVKLAQIRSIIQRLDQPMKSGGPAGNIWVVYLKNADAVKLATVLRAAFSPNSGGGGGSSGLSNTGNAGTGALSGLQNTGGLSSSNSLGGGGSSGSSGGLGNSAATAPLQASQGPSTGGFIQADPSTNSLIITAPEPLYRQVRAAIDQLDSRRAQIYVESMIVKVNAEKLGQFGVQWQHLFGNTGDSTLLGLGTNSSVGGNNILALTAATAGGVQGVAGAVGSIASGLNVGVIRKIGSTFTLGAVAHFLENNVGANLLSTPNLISLDNEEAKIVIGQNVPFVTGTYANTGGSSTVTPFQTIERQDVGLTLRIKSQIGEGGTIRMTIYQENSSVLSTSSTAGPTTDKSSIETSVVVDDGQIMVLGGLLKDEYTDGEDRIPGLSGLPVVGNLFRNEQRKRVKTNLMVFLRPVVIRDQATANSLTIDRYESIRALQQSGQPTPSVVIPVNEAPVLPALPPQPAAPVPAPLGQGVLPPEGAASAPR